MIPVIMPQVGQDIPRGEIVEWLKAEGDRVEKGEVVLVVESEKASFEVEAEESGVLLKVLYGEGEEVDILSPVAYVGRPGETVPEPEEQKAAPVEAPQPGKPAAAAAMVRQRTEGRVRASPSARRLARERDVDLSTVTGTGPGGRITKEDVAAAAEGPDTVVPFGKVRKRIAERLTLSARTIPHFYVSVEVDMTGAQARRRAFNEGQAAHVTVTDLVIRAAALALCKFGRLNAHAGEDRMILKEDVNVGVAVGVEDGLLVPVIPQADRRDLVELSRLSKEIAEDARRGVDNSTAEGTFTVTSLGMCGVTEFLPLINPPECGILAVGAIVKRVMPASTGFAVREMMTLTLACDHRAVDGTYAAAFLNDVKHRLEEPADLLADAENQQC